MKRLELPQAVAAAVDDLQDATRDLVEATRESRPDAILEAMRRRSRAVDRLGRALDGAAGRELAPEDRASLLEMIFHQSLEADARLGRMQEWLRDELRVLPADEDALDGLGEETLAADRPDRVR
jgi:hypothetical protein